MRTCYFVDETGNTKVEEGQWQFGETLNQMVCVKTIVEEEVECDIQMIARFLNMEDTSYNWNQIPFFKEEEEIENLLELLEDAPEPETEAEKTVLTFVTDCLIKKIHKEKEKEKMNRNFKSEATEILATETIKKGQAGYLKNETLIAFLKDAGMEIKKKETRTVLFRKIKEIAGIVSEQQEQPKQTIIDVQTEQPSKTAESVEDKKETKAPVVDYQKGVYKYLFKTFDETADKAEIKKVCRHNTKWYLGSSIMIGEHLYYCIGRADYRTSTRCMLSEFSDLVRVNMDASVLLQRILNNRVSVRDREELFSRIQSSKVSARADKIEVLNTFYYALKNKLPKTKTPNQVAYDMNYGKSYVAPKSSNNNKDTNDGSSTEPSRRRKQMQAILHDIYYKAADNYKNGYGYSISHFTFKAIILYRLFGVKQCKGHVFTADEIQTINNSLQWFLSNHKLAVATWSVKEDSNIRLFSDYYNGSITTKTVMFHETSSDALKYHKLGIQSLALILQ